MTPTAQSTHGSAGSGDVTAAIPVGTSPGDVLMLFAKMNGIGFPEQYPTISVPGEWTPLSDRVTGFQDKNAARVWFKTAGDSEPPVVVSTDTGKGGDVWIVAIDGVGDKIAGPQIETTDLSTDFPSVSITLPSPGIVIYAAATTGVVGSLPASITSLWAPGGNAAGFAAGYATAPAGTFTTGTGTESVGVYGQSAGVIAIASPAPAGPAASIFDGTTETPATVSVWDGSTETPATLELAT